MKCKDCKYWKYEDMEMARINGLESPRFDKMIQLRKCSLRMPTVTESFLCDSDHGCDLGEPWNIDVK